MGRLTRGWGLAKQSLAVVLADASLGALVVLGAAVSGAVALALLLPAAILYDDGQTAPAVILGVIGAYLGTFIATFFAVALAAAAAEVLDGRNVTVADAVAVAWRNVGAIAGWAVVLLTVNLVLQAVASRLGPVGRIVIGVVGAAWGLVSFLVVPVIALEGLGPLDALHRSGTLFRERWGEQVVGQASIAGVFVLVALLPAGLLLALATLGPGEGIGPFEIVALAAAILVLLVASVLGSAARAIFSVALLRYAAGDGAHGPFSATDLEGAVRTGR
jgi:hypothetical protein